MQPRRHGLEEVGDLGQALDRVSVPGALQPPVGANVGRVLSAVARSREFRSLLELPLGCGHLKMRRLQNLQGSEDDSTNYQKP